MDLMQQWIRNSEDIKQVEVVPNNISCEFVSEGQITILKNLVVFAYGLPHSHFLAAF